MDVSPTTTSYIPVTSEAHYSQVTSVGSIPANSDGNHNNTDSLPSGTQLLRTEGEVSASHTSSYDELHMVSTSTQSSSVTSSAPPEYAIATSHIQEIPHQTLGLTSIESLSPSHGNESGIFKEFLWEFICIHSFFV